jgi:cell division protein FtsL
VNTFVLLILAATLLVSFGVLIGCTFSERLLDARARRQAAVQRSLNEQWQELEVARKIIAQQRIGEPRKPLKC